METVVIGSDHVGWELKKVIAEMLQKNNYQVLDIGVETPLPVDYVDITVTLAKVIQKQQAKKGIMICGNGVGSSIAANKLQGVRAAICHDNYSVAQGVIHDDMNVLCISSSVIGTEIAKKLISTFLKESFSEEEKDQKRVDKIKAFEQLS